MPSAIILALIFFLATSSALKILIYSPKYAYSHMIYLGLIADTLQRAGHNVTVLQPVIYTHHRGSGCEVAKVIEVEQDELTRQAAMTLKSGDFWTKAFTAGEVWGSYEPVNQLRPIFAASCKDMLSKKELIEEMRNEKFDIGINEFFDFCGFSLFYEMRIFNVIGASSYVLPEWPALAIGIPVVPSYLPGVTGSELSFWRRCVNLLFTYLSYRFQAEVVASAEEAVSLHFPNQPSIWEMIRENVSFAFTQSDPLRDFPRPTTYGIVDLGGIGMKETHRLDEEWLKILSLRPKNVLVSFGSIAHASIVPLEMRKSMAVAFSRFPEVTFIWKYKLNDEIASNAENIVARTWLPQSDLLASGKIDLFVSHGGATSTTEASFSGVPMVVVPLFGDQPRNGRMIERLGSGLYFNKNDLENAQKLADALRRGLEDQSLQKSAAKVQKIMKKRPIPPEVLVVKTVELAAEVGPGGHLLTAGRRLGFISYFDFDILFFVMACICGFSFEFYRLFNCFFSVLRCRLRKAKEE